LFWLKKETEKSDRLTGIRLDKASAGTDRLFGRKHLDNRELGKMRRYRAERRGARDPHPATGGDRDTSRCENSIAHERGPRSRCLNACDCHKHTRYDGDGNLLTSLAPGNQRTTNTWDGENRLTLTALPSGIVDSFTYNGDGLRVQKIDSTGTTNHVWDGQNILLETNASNIIQVVYALEPSIYGNLISQSRSGVDTFYVFDALGSTRQLASSTGSVM
jgi:YD repeat-containing protein